MQKPDGRLAWGVAFAACFIQLVIIGLCRTNGILYVAIIKVFNISRKQAVAPFSIAESTRFIFGPVVGILGQKYSVRAMVVAGGIISTLSHVFCYFAPDINWITFLWGGIHGIGMALTTIFLELIVGQYFEKKRTTAIGLAVSGGSIGGVLCPILIQYSLYKYGLHSNFLVMAGVIIHIIPASIILKEPPWMRARKNNQPSLSVDEKSAHVFTIDTSDKINDINHENPYLEENYVERQNYYRNLNLIGSVRLKNRTSFGSSEIPFFGNEILFSSTLFETINFLYSILEHKSKNTIQFNDTDILSLVQNFLYKLYDCIGDQNNTNNCSTTSAQSKYSSIEPRFVKFENIVESILKEFKKDEVVKEFLSYLKNTDSEVFKSPSSKDMLLIISQIANKFESGKLSQPSRLELGKVRPDKDTNVKTSIESSFRTKRLGFLDYIKTVLKLNSTPIFPLICLCRTISLTGFLSISTILVDFVIDKGLQVSDGKFIVAALSIGDLVGRLGSGWITDRDYVTLPRFMLSVMVIQGAITGALPWIYNKWAFLCAITLFGALQGSLFVRHPVLVMEYMDPHQHSIAMSFINFLSGLLGFGLPACIGYIRDTLGSYDHLFHIAGVLVTCIGLLWIFEPRFNGHRRTPTLTQERKTNLPV